MQDEPNTHLTEVERSEAVANEIGAALLVAEAAREQLGSYLDDDLQVADVEVSLTSEADLHVPDAGRAGPGFLGTVHALAMRSGSSSDRRRRSPSDTSFE